MHNNALEKIKLKKTFSQNIIFLKISCQNHKTSQQSLLNFLLFLLLVFNFRLLLQNIFSDERHDDDIIVDPDTTDQDDKSNSLDDIRVKWFPINEDECPTAVKWK